MSLLPPLVEPILSLFPGPIERRLAGPLERDEDWLLSLAEPFMVPAIEGRDAVLLLPDGGGGGPMDVLLFDVGGMMDLRDEGVLDREGVERPGDGLGPGGLVGESLGFCRASVRIVKQSQSEERGSREIGRFLP